MKRRVLAVGITIALLCGIFLPFPSAFAADSQVNVVVGDVCPNIPGNQPTIPSGMQLDQSGNCVTPDPTPADACPNIDGNQTAIPAGYYRNRDGRCIKQTSPPQDVCANIPGTQPAVPEGYLTTAENGCELPPSDACDNIDGTQVALPDGMKRDAAGVCFTPSAPSTPEAPAKNTSGSGSSSSNIPLGILLIPFYPAALLLIVALFLLLQNFREAAAATLLFILLARRGENGAKRDNFLGLCAQLLVRSIDFASVDGKLSANTGRALAAKRQAAEAVVTALSSTRGEGPVLEQRRTAMSRRKLFVLPASLMVFLSVGASIVVGYTLPSSLTPLSIVLQVALCVIAIGVFLAVLRTRHAHHVDRKNNSRLLDYEDNLDELRRQNAGRLASLMAETNHELSRATPSSDQGSVLLELRTLEDILRCFESLGQSRETQPLPLRQLTDDIAAKFSKQLAASNIFLDNHIDTRVSLNIDGAAFRCAVATLLGVFVESMPSRKSILFDYENKALVLTVDIELTPELLQATQAIDEGALTNTNQLLVHAASLIVHFLGDSLEMVHDTDKTMARFRLSGR